MLDALIAELTQRLQLPLVQVLECRRVGWSRSSF